jgi:lysosomal acid lipase/cholesteryl ester hydrolase
VRDGRTRRPPGWLLALIVGVLPGCAAMRHYYPNFDLQPCRDGYADTTDGWRLGVKHYRPRHPDPDKYPVVLCHGLGLNGTFWTITPDHLPSQLAARGYEVFVVDMRGSGASYRKGVVGHVNSALRQTFLLEIGEGRWNVDDEALYDVPAILEYVQRQTGKERVNWVGHSLGGMLMFPFLELYPEPRRVATFVAMGSPAVLESAPETTMLNANRNLRKLLLAMSTSRIARPLMLARPPGLDRIDRFYYSAENVDRATINRFYGFTLEDPGPGALRQLDHYLEHGRLVSADRKVDYAALLGRVQTPILLVAGEGDVLAPMESMEQTYEALGSPDKTLARFGKAEGHRADYGHCDLVWSRHAPKEVFPVIADWLDRRQPVRPSPQGGPSPQDISTGPAHAGQRW